MTEFTEFLLNTYLILGIGSLIWGFLSFIADIGHVIYYEHKDRKISMEAVNRWEKIVNPSKD